MPRTGPPPESPYPGPPTRRHPEPPAAAPEAARADARPARGGGGMRTGLVALVAGLVGGALALGGAALSGTLGDEGDTIIVRDALPLRGEVGAGGVPGAELPAVVTAPRSPATPGAVEPVQEVVARTSPAVVKITVGDPEAEDDGRLGSGFVISRDGLVLSNSHVVEDAETVLVTFDDGTETEAEVLGRDESTDLAVIRVDELPAGVRPLALGTTEGLVVGDGVIAIGNPFGLERTATTGIISALKRIIRAPNGFEIQNTIQTDAAINQGNSGGPLLDSAGRVLGINSQIATGSGGNDGIGFAVPIDTLRPVVNAIVRSGRPEHAWLGVTGRQVTPAIAEELDLGDTRGVAVVAVDDRGPAEDAGLRAATTPLDVEVPRGGDIIVRVEGMPVADMADVSRQVSSRAVGDPLTLTVLRDGSPVTVTITLAARPGDVGLAPGGRP